MIIAHNHGFWEPLIFYSLNLVVFDILEYKGLPCATQNVQGLEGLPSIIG
jgi:hypothetical protein